MKSNERKLKLNRKMLLLACICLFGVACTKKAKLETGNQKSAYALGQNIGNSLKNQPTEVDLPALFAGITDAIKDKDSQLSVEQIQAAISEMQHETMKKAAADGAINESESEKFLATNKAAPGWQVSTTGLQYKVVKEGDGAAPVSASDIVQISYTGKLLSGQVFESTKEIGHPVIYSLRDVIPGWAEALKLIKAGGEIEIVVPSALAYGMRGHGVVGPNSAVTFDLSLLDVNPRVNERGVVMPTPSAAANKVDGARKKAR